jgi:hypothetical protein
MTVLLNEVDVDTTSSEFRSRGGPALVVVRGDSFGTGTVNIELATDADPQSRFALFPGGAFTANGSLTLDYLPVGTRIRADLTGSSAANDVFVEILQ